ncbi:MAG TPA: OmpA family protein [Polyangiaceae bacterium]|nr:OmpA family protein [Polyangiaceae bacterium]
MRTSLFTLSLVSLTALACASTAPSPELLDARRAYESARVAPEARYTPDRVLEAKQALDRAEYAHEKEPGSYEEKSLAYIAERRAELAIVYGQYDADRRMRHTADAQYKAREDVLRREAEANAAETRRVLEGTRATLGTVQGNPADGQQARQRADSGNAAALSSLNQIARVEDDARGTVITLDGSLLFAANKSELLPSARQKLDDVAKALKDGAENITVLGHADSQGMKAEANPRLSQERADAVRAYLVERGVAPDRMKAVGAGATEPVSSKATPAGRADGGRIEIVVEKRRAP